jgi:hypothetical protein
MIIHGKYSLILFLWLWCLTPLSNNMDRFLSEMWYFFIIFFSLKLPVQLVLITTEVVSSNPGRGEEYTGSFKEKKIIEKYHISDRKRFLMKYCLYYATIYKIKKIMIDFKICPRKNINEWWSLTICVVHTFCNF